MLPIAFCAVCAALGITFGAVAQSSAFGASVEWILDRGSDADLVEINRPGVIVPADVKAALEFYRNGQYRRAAEILQKYRDLKLPDGQLDFYCFALAESKRMQGIRDAELYSFIVEHFPHGDKAAPASFRLFEFACDDGNELLADSIYDAFSAQRQAHPLFPSVQYRMARFLFANSRYAEAAELLEKISPRSSRSLQANLLNALCQIKLKNADRALVLLDYVRRNGQPHTLGAEACIIMGDLFYEKGDSATALRYYQNVDKASLRSDYARLRSVRCLLDAKEYAKGLEIAQLYLRENPNGKYSFEMLSLAEEAYRAMGDARRAAKIGAAVYRQVMNARISFGIYEELGRIISMHAAWSDLQFRALENKNQPLQDQARESLSKLRSLEKRYWELLRNLTGGRFVDMQHAASILAIRKYVEFINDSIRTLEDSAVLISGQQRQIGQHDSFADSSVWAEISRLKLLEENAKMRIARLEREKNLVMQGALARNDGVLDQDEPVKFIDWAFLRYQAKKQSMLDMNAKLKNKLAHAKNDSASFTQVERIFSLSDREKLAAEIARDRAELIRHAESMAAYFPRNQHIASILFRLAELFYDEASEDFDIRLRKYEADMASGGGKLEFPEYDLSKVVAMYDHIMTNYPSSELVDDACFYKALALQKMGMVKEANAVFQELVRRYPGSEYYVEANMIVGRYYFEHPQEQGNTGYKLAEEAFREVLYYRDHPQYVQALYNLGWCYYMQDQYEEAIAVFKYLIEELQLDFDPSKAPEKQVVNPLLREEAIDYIAISFDERNTLDDAVAFLRLIGNIDYAALVMKRIGELREEVQDNQHALLAYDRLLKEYPMALVAPEASARKIALYEAMGMPAKALEERDAFISRYARGGAWAAAQRDSTALSRVDSMTLANGFSVADLYFRRAQAANDTADYRIAARAYRRLVELYPEDARASEAQWNLAIILDQNLNFKKDAFAEYLKCSRMKSASAQRREQAALNALSLVQRSMPPDSLAEPGKLEPAAMRLIDAANNYIELFPEGAALNDVLLELGAVYFNRKLYANAVKAYERIVARGPVSEDYYRAMFSLGQCRFAEESWPSASQAFEEVAAKSLDFQRREEARTLLLQSEYLYAKQHFTSGNYEKAAASLLSIEDRFPGSQYGDIVLFNAAEAFEKKEKWQEACAAYQRLVKNYPASKLAADALFNAAGNYEKASNFEKAAESYESLVSRYGSSPKAKDALFNLGFCYEKLGKYDMMAEVNERYTALYPGEKDAMAMMLRAADFYFKAAMLDKAQNVYRNFMRRFGNEPQSVEALYMIGRIAQEQDDRSNALAFFTQAEQLHERLIKAAGSGNAYFAAEAAMAAANILRGDFLAIKFDQTGTKLKELQQKKSAVMADAGKAYTRVMQYRGEKMFEAGYRIAEMFEEYAKAWRGQRREVMDPVKEAVVEKEIAIAASSLYQKSFGPYKKVIELASGFDSLGPDQRRWVESAKMRLADGYVEAGNLLMSAIAAMYNAPIPKEIQKKPLHYFQYRRQLAETLEPMKLTASSFFLSAYRDLKMLGSDLPQTQKCLDKFCQVNYLMGEDYEKIGEKIIKNEYDRPQNISAEEEEEISFQLEDILFELQDKAIFAYEDALKRIQQAGAQDNPWHARVMASLARLSPDVYGKSVFSTVAYASGAGWAMRADSVKDWCDAAPVRQGWTHARIASISGPSFPSGKAAVIGSETPGAAFLRGDVFINGIPRSASLYFATTCGYTLYINGKAVASDTSSNRTLSRIDSFTNVGALFRGGDNVIGVHALGSSAGASMAMLAVVMIDTSQRFTSAIAPLVEAEVSSLAAATVASANVDVASAAGAGADTTGAASFLPSIRTRTRAQSAAASAPQSSKASDGWVAATGRQTRTEVIRTIEEYLQREALTSKDIKRERIAIQRAQAQREEIEARLRGVEDEIASLRNEMQSMQNSK